MGINKKTAIVGTPCQILASTKINSYENETSGSSIDYKIGLFCMENFSYSYLIKFLEYNDIKINDISEFRIENNQFKVFLNSRGNGNNNKEEVSFPLEETHSFKRQNCEICVDFASDLSDISIGSVGSPKGYSTLITRTKKGQDLVESAQKENYIILESLDDDSREIAILKKIANKKKKENLNNIKERENQSHPVLYTRKIPDSEIKELSKQSQFDNLNKDVISERSCVLCGVCEYVCPSDIIQINERKPAKYGECEEDCHACYYACPRTFLSEKIRPQELNSEAIGQYKNIYSAKSKIIEYGQDGGVITSLLLYLLEKNITDDVLIVGEDKENPWKPKSKLTNNTEDVKKAAGTKYSTVPIAFKGLKT